MPKVFYYFNHTNYPIQVTDETCILTQYTFQENNELWENKSIQQFFSNIDTDKNYNIIDIGAQSGLYSLYAKYIPKCNFYSFEPYTPSFNLLNENIKLNEINNVKTFNIGLSNIKTTTELSVCKSHNGLHSLSKSPLRFNDVDKLLIQTDTIDNLFYEKSIPVDFIKIDTEGHEYFILQGAINTIKKYKPVIQLEWNLINMAQCEVTEKMILDLVSELNYIEKSMVEEEKLFIPKNFNI